MDPLTAVLAFALQNPAVVGSAASAALSPGQVREEQLTSSLADFARETLKCYHKTANFKTVDILGRGWPRMAQYGASQAFGIQLAYQGVSGAKYQMVLVVLAKPGHLRTVVLADSATFPYSKKCRLEEWVAVPSAK